MSEKRLKKTIKNLRQNLGLEIKDLAEMSNVSRSVISRIENGHYKNKKGKVRSLHHATKSKLAQALNEKPEEITDFADNQELSLPQESNESR